jgi:hypothetical protein
VADGSSPETIVSVYQQASHPLLNETREDRFMKDEKADTQENTIAWSTFENEKTTNLMEVACLIFDELALEIYQELLGTAEDAMSHDESVDFQHVSGSSSLSDFELC